MPRTVVRYAGLPARSDLGGALTGPPLNAFEYNPTHLVQRTSTSNPLEILRRGARANHCSRVGEIAAMVALDEFLAKECRRNSLNHY